MKNKLNQKNLINGLAVAIFSLSMMSFSYVESDDLDQQLEKLNEKEQALEKELDEKIENLHRNYYGFDDEVDEIEAIEEIEKLSNKEIEKLFEEAMNEEVIDPASQKIINSLEKAEKEKDYDAILKLEKELMQIDQKFEETIIAEEKEALLKEFELEEKMNRLMSEYDVKFLEIAVEKEKILDKMGVEIELK